MLALIKRSETSASDVLFANGRWSEYKCAICLISLTERIIYFIDRFMKAVLLFYVVDCGFITCATNN